MLSVPACAGYEAVAALQETRRLAEEARRRRQAEGDERWRAQEALRAVHAREQQLALREQAVQLQEERQAAQYQVLGRGSGRHPPLKLSGQGEATNNLNQ